jgi:hypothetical protein
MLYQSNGDRNSTYIGLWYNEIVVRLGDGGFRPLKD